MWLMAAEGAYQANKPRREHMFLRALRLLGPTQPRPWTDAPLILLLSRRSSTAQDGEAGAARHFQSKIQT